MRKTIISIAFVSLVLCTGCAKTADSATEQTVQQSQNETLQDDSATKDVFAMDTYMTLTAYGARAQQAVDAAAQRIEELDAKLSTGSEESEISKLNQTGSGNLSEETYYLLEEALHINQRTEGAFNPAIYPLVELWGFPTKEFRVPDRAEIETCREKTDINQISIDSDKRYVEFGISGMKLDFGGIAKGYTSSQVMDIFREYGIESGIVNLGGNVQTLGTKEDGSFWRVAIQNPDDGEDYLGVLETSDKAVITSGGYERYFEENGVIYHHILNPATGYPAQSGLKSVTIVSENGLLADGLSTSFFVMGLDKATGFYWENAGEFDAIFMTDSDEVYVTEGIAQYFSTSYELHVIDAVAQ